MASCPKSKITVDPVVVIPDILSKKDSLKDKFKSESKKGKLPNNAILNHAKVENKKACWRLSCFSFFRLVRIVRIPIKIVIIEDDKKLLLIKLVEMNMVSS